jgi:hypothetical protein
MLPPTALSPVSTVGQGRALDPVLGPNVRLDLRRHHVLGDAGVELPGPESVTELVGGDSDRLAGFAVQANDALPVSELLGEGAVRVGPGAVVVAGDAGEQPRAAR